MLSAAEIIRRYQVIIGHLGNGGEKKNHALPPTTQRKCDAPTCQCLFFFDSDAPLGYVSLSLDFYGKSAF